MSAPTTTAQAAMKAARHRPSWNPWWMRPHDSCCGETPPTQTEGIEMAVMTKTEFVLDIAYVTTQVASFYPSGDDDRRPGPTLLMPRSTYDDLGEPQVITVTVVPGDNLNG